MVRLAAAAALAVALFAHTGARAQDRGDALTRPRPSTELRLALPAAPPDFTRAPLDGGAVLLESGGALVGTIFLGGSLSALGWLIGYATDTRCGAGCDGPVLGALIAAAIAIPFGGALGALATGQVLGRYGRFEIALLGATIGALAIGSLVALAAAAGATGDTFAGIDLLAVLAYAVTPAVALELDGPRVAAGATPDGAGVTVSARTTW